MKKIIIMNNKIIKNNIMSKYKNNKIKLMIT